MKIFVSKYWQINILVFIILECMGIIGISSMCIPDLKEGRIDIISLAYGLGAVALAAFLLFRMRNVMQYVIIGSGYAVTHTATGKKLTLDNDTFENTGKSRFFERRTSRVLY